MMFRSLMILCALASTMVLGHPYEQHPRAPASSSSAPASPALSNFGIIGSETTSATIIPSTTFTPFSPLFAPASGLTTSVAATLATTAAVDASIVSSGTGTGGFTPLTTSQSGATPTASSTGVVASSSSANVTPTTQSIPSPTTVVATVTLPASTGVPFLSQVASISLASVLSVGIQSQLLAGSPTSTTVNPGPTVTYDFPSSARRSFDVTGLGATIGAVLVALLVV